MLQSGGCRFVATLALAMVFGMGAAPVSRGGHWDAAHPRRAEVNERLAHQRAWIRRERVTGEITVAQARRLHREDHAIRVEERAMARQHGGHITHAEARLLNQQENGVGLLIDRW
jgi:hypothetical protein